MRSKRVNDDILVDVDKYILVEALREPEYRRNPGLQGHYTYSATVSRWHSIYLLYIAKANTTRVQKSTKSARSFNEDNNGRYICELKD